MLGQASEKPDLDKQKRLGQRVGGVSVHAKGERSEICCCRVKSKIHLPNPNYWTPVWQTDSIPPEGQKDDLTAADVGYP
jgi:hypothetical protein